MANNTLLEELIPDFDDMDKVAEASSQARLLAHMVKDELEAYIANCINEAYRNPEFWIASKPPTQTFIERKVAIVGNTIDDAKKIKELKDRFSELQKEVDETRALLNNMRDRVSAFQTISSNRRAGVT